MTTPTNHTIPRAHTADSAWLALCLAVLGVTVAYPTFHLVLSACRAWDTAAVFAGQGGEAIRNTALIGLASVLTSGIVGTAAAWVFARHAFSGRSVLAALAYLPFTLPPLVGTLSFYYLIGRDGLLPRLIERCCGVNDAVLPGPAAILLIHTYSFYVFFYAMVSAALTRMDPSQEEAARTLGASRVRVLLRVTLPALKPALLGAALLTFMSSCASFSAPYFFGGGYPMLSVRIFEERSQFDEAAAIMHTAVLALTALLGLVFFRTRTGPAGAASKGARSPIANRAARTALTCCAWAGVGLVLVPHLSILWLSVVDHRLWHTELLPSALTLRHYVTLFEDARSFAPIRNSLWMGALGTLGALAAGLPAAYLIARKRPHSAWVNLLAMLPWALPGTVIAINLIVAFNSTWLPLYNTVWILPLAYFVRSVPLLTRMTAAAIEAFDASLIEAGRTLGASAGYCLRRIALPLIAPAVCAAAAMAFASNLGEFPASILLYSPSNVPIAVKINMEWRGDVGVAFAYSVLLMALVAATFGLSRRFTSRIL